jgi:ATP-dependent protease ClpP protease subunit
MLIKFLLAICLLAIPTKPELIEPELIEFKKDNFVSLRETINQDSSSRLLTKLNLIETKHNTIYLYLNSPGGDVMAGLEIINYIKSFIQLIS